MFGVSGWDLIVLGVVAMVLVGPERLPKLAAEAAQWVRRIREVADRARNDLEETVGPEAASFVDDLRGLADLHPKNIIANAMSDQPPRGAGRAGAAGAGAAGAGAAGTGRAGRAPGSAPSNGASSDGASADGTSGSTPEGFDPDTT